MLSFIILDAAPSPAILLYMMLGIAGLFIIISLITVAFILTIKAIKKRKNKKDAKNR